MDAAADSFTAMFGKFAIWLSRRTPSGRFRRSSTVQVSQGRLAITRRGGELAVSDTWAGHGKPEQTAPQSCSRG
jgi:hypothetical protein